MTLTIEQLHQHMVQGAHKDPSNLLREIMHMLNEELGIGRPAAEPTPPAADLDGDGDPDPCPEEEEPKTTSRRKRGK